MHVVQKLRRDVKSIGLNISNYQAIIFRNINEKHGQAASEIHGKLLERLFKRETNLLKVILCMQSCCNNSIA